MSVKSAFTKDIKVYLSIVLAASALMSMSFSFCTDPMDMSIAVKELSPITQDISKISILESSAKGTELAAAVSTKGVNVGTGQEVSKLVSLGALQAKKASNNLQNTFNGYEGLKLIVDFAGRGANVQNRINAQGTGLSAERKSLITNNEYLAEAKLMAIISPDEEKYLKVTVPREVFGMWLARSAGMTATTGRTDVVNTVKDESTINPTYRNMVETLLSNGVLVTDKDGKFRATSPITYSEAVNALGASLSNMTSVYGLNTDFGLVIGKKVQNTKSQGKTISTVDYVMRKADGSLVKLRTNKQIPGVVHTDFVVNKNGKVGTSTLLTVGDEIEFYTKNNIVTFARTIDGNTMLSQQNEDRKKEQNLQFSFGVVGVKKIERKWNGSGFDALTRVRIQNYDGEVVDFVIKNKINQDIINDVLVVKNGKVTGVESLQKGDQVEYLIKNDSEISYVLPKKFSIADIKGVIKGYTGDAASGNVVLTIFDFDNRNQNYPLAPYAPITYGSGFGKVGDFKSGLEVVAHVTNGYITKLSIVDQNENASYIEPLSKIKMGTIIKISDDKLQVQLNTGDTEIFSLKKGTDIFRNRVPSTIAALKVGDNVRMLFNNIAGDIPQRIEIETKILPLKQIYKGELSSLDFASGTLSLTNAMYLNNITWIQNATYKKDIQITPRTEIYYENNKVLLDEIGKNHIGDTMYVAVEDNYGTESAVKVSIKQGREQTFLDRVANIDQIQKVLELKNNVNIGFGDGTIVIKDNRIVSRDNLSLKDNVIVMSGVVAKSNNANLIQVITTPGKVMPRLVLGSILMVNPNTFAFDYTSHLTEANLWTPIMIDKTTLYSINNESNLIDLTNSKKLSALDFFNGKYGKYDNPEYTGGMRYKRYYGYAVVDSENQVIAMNLRKKGLLPNQNIDDHIDVDSSIATELMNLTNTLRSSKGVVESIDTSNARIKMSSSFDWSNAKESWQSNPVSTYVNYTDAIFVNNGKTIPMSEVNIGDQLYVIRSNEAGLIFIVNPE